MKSKKNTFWPLNLFIFDRDLSGRGHFVHPNSQHTFGLGYPL